MTPCESWERPFQQLYKGLKPAFEGRTIIFSRHGESLYNLDDRLGGNPRLSPRGELYAKKFAAYVNGLQLSGLELWVSELQRTQQTAAGIATSAGQRRVLAPLNELDSGDMDDLTYDEFEGMYPKEFSRRQADKLRYRYPQGESYLDVCERLSNVLPQMNDSHNLVVVSHQAVLRCVFGFLLQKPADEIPYIKVPLHTVITVTCRDGQNWVKFHKLDVACVDTYKPRLRSTDADQDDGLITDSERSSVKISPDWTAVSFSQGRKGESLSAVRDIIGDRSRQGLG